MTRQLTTASSRGLIVPPVFTVIGRSVDDYIQKIVDVQIEPEAVVLTKLALYWPLVLQRI